MSDQQDPRPSAALPDGVGRHRAAPPTDQPPRVSRASGRHRAAPAESAAPAVPAAEPARPAPRSRRAAAPAEPTRAGAPARSTTPRARSNRSAAAAQPMRPDWHALDRNAATAPASTAAPSQSAQASSSAAALFSQADAHPRPGRRPGRRRRRLIGALVVLLAFGATLGAGALAVDVLGLLDPRPEPTTEAATWSPPVHTPTGPAAVVPDYTGFDPAHVIDDEVFFDVTSMTLEDVAAFIDEVNEGCVPGNDGTPCLAEAVFTTEDYEPGPGCAGGYTGAEGETAAEVITNVATSCGVSPRVLLALIQKEQGLLTASGESLSAHDYEAAAGYDCPDGGTCDPEHAGFFRQVYGAAAQFQRYHQDPWGYEVIAGETSTLGYAPTEACGTGEITPVNQATAGLYNYTPYLLNEAAWDGGDDCTTWGTLNFYGYYRTWFGDPTPSTGD